MHLLLQLGAICLTAILLAYWEVQIEGPRGWAQGLPTWRSERPWVTRLLGGRPLTGYHLAMVLTILSLLHLPLTVVGWSVRTEASILGAFILLLTLEDFLWFVLNPAWGLRRFRPGAIWWHPGWLLGLPSFYWVTLFFGGALLFWGSRA